MADEVGPSIEAPEGILFAFDEISYSPEAPKMDEPFTVKGKINLLKIPFVGPVWVIATATYPETWWEEIIPIIGSPEVRATDIALGGNFEITFPTGFQREGEFELSVRVYAGPTVPLGSIVIPPAPAAATYETTFIVAGKIPPQEELFKEFSITSYSKNGDTPVTPPSVLELDVGDRCRVNLVFSHQGPAVSGKFHAAIWHKGLIDPHDEILYKELSFSVPQSDDWETYEASVDIIITSAISPGSDYGLYCKIIGITGGDVFTEFLENIIAISGGEYPGQPGDVKISGNWINLGSAKKKAMPYSCDATEDTLEIGVSYKNVSSTSIIMGADIIITKPDGSKAGIRAVDYAGISPGEELSVEYNIYDSKGSGSATRVNQAGDWEIEIKLVDRANGTILDSWSGTCLVVGEVLAQGSIISKYINKAPEGNRIPLPATVKVDNNTFEVGVTAKNISSAAFVGAIEVKVYDPDGTYRPSDPDTDWAGISPGETLRWEYNISEVDKAGDWTINIRLLERDTSAVLAEEQVTMTATDGVTEKEPPRIEVDVENITGRSAKLVAELIREGFCSGAYCYFEWGKTTSYGKRSDEVRLQPGRSMTCEIENLEPGTRYYYRAVAEGRCVSPYLTHADERHFTTEEVELLDVYVAGYRKNGKSYDSPQNIRIGDEVGVQFNYKNASDETLEVRADLKIYSRGYTSAARIGTSSGWKTMNPGKTRAIHLEFDADVVSDWTAKLVLKVDGVGEVYDREILIGYGVS